MPFLQVNEKRISLNNLDRWQPTSPFELNARKFIRQWLAGKADFELKTSGSTGTPKTIRVSRQQMIASARLTLEALNLKKNGTALVCLDTAYIAGKMMLVRALLHEMNLILRTPSSNPLEGLKVQPDFAALVPLQLQVVLSDRKSTDILNSMQAVIIGGAPIDASLQHKLDNIKAPLYATYGMTETVSHIALKKLNGPNRSDIFEAFKEVELGQDERECLTIRSVVTNYETIITNDRVRLHGTHRFEWIGRVDNVINSGGIKVQSEQVEKVIGKVFNELSINYRCFIAGIPDKHLGERVILAVETALPLPEEETILNLLKQRLGRFEAPKTMLYFTKFIETPTGKVNRKGTLEKSR